jgi:predicted aspartyl protease
MYDVHTEITLKNGWDVEKAADGLIKESDVRQETVQAVVDTGAWNIVINEEIRSKLGLKIKGTDTVTLADLPRVAGSCSCECSIVGPLEIWWKDRWFLQDALMLPNAGEILLGAIPLEALDLTVNPRLGEVVGAHGDQPLHRLY